MFKFIGSRFQIIRTYIPYCLTVTPCSLLRSPPPPPPPIFGWNYCIGISITRPPRGPLEPVCSVTPFSCEYASLCSHGYTSLCSITPFSCGYASLCSVTPSSSGYISLCSLGYAYTELDLLPLLPLCFARQQLQLWCTQKEQSKRTSTLGRGVTRLKRSSWTHRVSPTWRLQASEQLLQCLRSSSKYFLARAFTVGPCERSLQASSRSQQDSRILLVCLLLFSSLLF